MTKQCILLVPGFFGFEDLAGIRYFLNVSEALEKACARHGADVTINELSIPPTASIRHRASKVREAIAELAAQHPGCEIHLVGHSTGGLDARLAISEQVHLTTELTPEVFKQVKSLVTISTPHYGTPLAEWFGTFMGKPLLKVLALSLVYSLRVGRVPLEGALMLSKVALHANDLVGLRDTVLRTLFEQILQNLSPARREMLGRLLAEVASDQSLLFQLTPEGVDLINATTPARSDIRYGSVVTLGPKPALSSTWVYRSDIFGASMFGLYTVLYRFAGGMPISRLPEINGSQGNRLLGGFGRLPDRNDNDGIVPTVSQLWGEVIDAVEADHFDVVGHYNDPLATIAHVDWLPSASSFNKRRFEMVWQNVANFLLGYNATSSPTLRLSREILLASTGSQPKMLG